VVVSWEVALAVSSDCERGAVSVGSLAGDVGAPAPVPVSVPRLTLVEDTPVVDSDIPLPNVDVDGSSGPIEFAEEDRPDEDRPTERVVGKVLEDI
jgi:hypothetical protein